MQEPTEEIRKLSTYLTNAVNKSKKKKVSPEIEKRKNLERQQNVVDFSPLQTETMVF